MNKLCPFMSEDMTSYKAKNIPCVDSCALRWEGYCSINILAQKAINDFKKEKNNKEKSIE